MFYNYILKSTKTGEFYKGFSDDIERRIHEHEVGKVASTKNKRPWLLVHVELTKSKIEARELEKFFKSGYGREVVQQIAEEFKK